MKTYDSKKFILLILHIIPIIILIQFGAMVFFGIRWINNEARRELLDERNTAAKLVAQVLQSRQFEPAIELSKMELPQQNLEAARLGLKYTEVNGIYFRNQSGKFINLFSAAPADILKGVTEAAEIIVDKNNFRNAFWDSDWKWWTEPVEISGRTIQLNLIKKGDDVRLITVDPDKLKPILPELFSQAVNGGNILVREYFKPPQETGAIAEFYDDSEESFFSFGEVKGRGWDDAPEFDYHSLGWRIKIQIFPQHQYLIGSANAADSWPWFPVVELVLAILSIVMLGFLAPRLR